MVLIDSEYLDLLVAARRARNELRDNVATFTHHHPVAGTLFLAKTTNIDDLKTEYRAKPRSKTLSVRYRYHEAPCRIRYYTDFHLPSKLSHKEWSLLESFEQTWNLWKENRDSSGGEDVAKAILQWFSIMGKHMPSNWVTAKGYQTHPIREAEMRLRRNWDEFEDIIHLNMLPSFQTGQQPVPKNFVTLCVIILADCDRADYFCDQADYCCDGPLEKVWRECSGLGVSPIRECQ